MKYILTILAAAFTFSACSTTTHAVKTSGKGSVADSCCKSEGACSKKH